MILPKGLLKKTDYVGDTKQGGYGSMGCFKGTLWFLGMKKGGGSKFWSLQFFVGVGGCCVRIDHNTISMIEQMMYFCKVRLDMVAEINQGYRY